MATLGSRIAEGLAARGVRVIFGIPGVHNQELYRALPGLGVAHVLARHEQGAGFMADGYARATGQPGVAFVITGPGLLNALTPLGQSYSDSVPVLLISSCLGDAVSVTGQLHQMIDQAGAARAVAAWSEEAATPEAAWRLIDRALGEFATRRPRPRHLQLPVPLLAAEAPEPPAPPQRATARPQPDAGAVEVAAAMIRAAQRPLILFGGGAAGADAAALMAATGAAAFVTGAGRGIVPPGHAMSFGGMTQRPGSEAVFAGADLLLALGTELAPVDFWRDHPGFTCALIRVDLDPAMLFGEHPAALAVQADAPAFAAALTAALAGHVPQTGWTPAEIAAARARWAAEVQAERPGPSALLAAITAALPAEALVYSDMTGLAYAAIELFEPAGPRQWHHPYGFGTLGYALPAAIGGKVGRPEAPVVALAGDYGFQYTLPELMVATELGLSLPILLWDNDALGEIEASMIRGQIAPNAVWQKNPDFGLIARAYGAAYAEPESLDAIGPALAAAFARKGPTIIRMTPALAGR